MNAPVDAGAKAQAIEFTLDGRKLLAAPGESILQTAKRHGVEIPHL